MCVWIIQGLVVVALKGREWIRVCFTVPRGNKSFQNAAVYAAHLWWGASMDAPLAEAARCGSPNTDTTLINPSTPLQDSYL
jgi:hypothetical protein